MSAIVAFGAIAPYLVDAERRYFQRFGEGHCEEHDELGSKHLAERDAKSTRGDH